MDNRQFHTDKIAILLATYNGARYLSEQLDSLLAQTNPDWITYIHDDGSTDGTTKIIDDYVARYPQKFIKVEGKSTGGAKANFFYLLSAVDAPYLMCCDQDDVWLPEKVETTYQAMKKLEAEAGEDKPLLVFTELRVVDGKLGTVAERMSDYQQLDCNRDRVEDIVVQNNVTGCTMMINRKLRELLGGKNRTHKLDMEQVIMHDWWCALIAVEFGKMKFISQPQILYRQHEDNSVGAKNAASVSYAAARLFKIREMKESLLLTRKQALEFTKCFELSKEHVVSRYAHIGSRNKFARIRFYKKNRMSKSGRARQLGFRIFG